MSNSFRSSKRRAEGELRKEDYIDSDDEKDPRGGEETFATEPQVASPEVLRTRRIVRVRRPGQESTTAMQSGTSASSQGKEEETKKGTTLASIGTGGDGSSFSFPATGIFKSLTSATPLPSTPTSIPLAFSGTMGLNKVEQSVLHTGEKSATNTTSASGTSTAGGPNNLGNKPKENSTATSFSFFSNSSSTVDSSTSSKPFSFSFGRFGIAPSSSSTTSAPFASGGSDTTTSHPVFPPGAFTFASAVSSFAEARKMVAEERQRKSNTEGEKGSGGEGSDEKDGEAEKSEDPSSGVFSSTSVIQPAPGEVMAQGNSKLYRFDKAGKNWVECGEGEAKIKKEKRAKKIKREGEDNAARTTATATISSSTSVENEGEEEEEEVTRLLVRDGYSLNVVVKNGVFLLTPSSSSSGRTSTSEQASTAGGISNAKKHIVFTVNSGDEGVMHYLLKFTGSAAEENAENFAVELKEALEKQA